MASLIDDILAHAKATPEEALKAFDSLEPVSTAFMRGRWKGSDIDTGHPLDGLFGASGFYGKIFLDDEAVHPLIFFGSGQKELYAINPKLVPFNMNLPKNKRTEKMVKMGRIILETKQSKARLRNLEYRGRSSASMIYDDLPIIDIFVKIDDNRVLGAMDLKGGAEPFFFVLERDNDSEYEIAPLKAIDEKVKDLFDMEIQNRAFALKSARTMAGKVSKEEDVYFCDAWVAFEEFLQEKYAPFAEKYGFSQEPRLKAKIEASLSVLGIDLLPNSILYKTVLDQTVKYYEKLVELPALAPEEDVAFFDFVVKQEAAQVDGLKLCVEGKIREAADLLKNFVSEHNS